MPSTDRLRGDFHIHSSFSKDCNTPPERILARCLEVGLNCVAITDHNNIDGARALKAIAPFTVIVAEEVFSSEGEIIGLFLSEPVPGGLPPLETINRIREQGGLVSIPHPFDRVRRGPLTKAALRKALPQADFVEAFNSRTLLRRDIEISANLLVEFPNLVPLVASDAHTPGEIGASILEFDSFDGTPEGFKSAVAGGVAHTRRTGPLVHAVTAVVKTQKLLKKRLGRDAPK